MKAAHLLTAAVLACVILLSATARGDEAPTVQDPPPSANQPATPPNAPTPQPEQPQQQQTDDDQKIVCKKEPPPVGSRMGGRKVCRTVAEWRRQQATARETTTEIQERKIPPPAS